MTTLTRHSDLLRNSHFIRLWLSQTASQAGDGFYLIAITWQTLEIDQSPAALGLLAAAMTSPLLLFGLFGGVITDRANRPVIAAICDLSRAGALLAIPILKNAGILQLWHLLVIAFLVAALETIFQPSVDALLPSLVQKEKLGQANGLLSASLQGAYFLSPAMAGLLISALTVTALFTIDSISYLLSALALFSLRGKEQVTRETIRQTSFWLELRSGLAAILRDRQLLLVISFFSLGTLVGGGVMRVALPLFADRVLHSGVEGYGYLVAAAGVGMIIANLLLALTRCRHKIKVILYSWLIFGALHIVFATTPKLVWALTVMLLLGTAGGLFQTLILTLIQERAPEEDLGKVFGISNTLVWGGDAISGPLVALYLTLFSIRSAFLASGLLLLLVGIYGLTKLRRADVTHQEM